MRGDASAVSALTIRRNGINFDVFSAKVAATALWKYGEDSLAERALDLSEADLARLAEIAGGYWRIDHRLPLESRLVADKAIAFSCIQYFEGHLRALKQERRRPDKLLPERFPIGRRSAGMTALLTGQGDDCANFHSP
jgi:hypothetical protein